MILTVSIDWEENDFWGREQVFFLKRLQFKRFCGKKCKKMHNGIIFPLVKA